MSAIGIGTARARRGETAWGQMLVREGRRKTHLPVAVVHGAKPGDHVVMLANQHGTELNGIEAIRLFVEQVDPRRMKGTVFAIPSANPNAAMLMNEYWPEDVPKAERERYRKGCNRGKDFSRDACRFNMNRLWPGAKGETLVARAVYEIWNRAILAPHQRASLVMDFHCHGAPSTISAAFPPEADLTVATGMGYALYSRSGLTRPFCRSACLKAGIQCVTFELEGQACFNPTAIEHGRRSIFNLLKFWGMLPGRLDLPAKKTVILDPWRDGVLKKKFKRASYMAVMSPCDGLMRLTKPAYAPVRKGEVVCEVLDPYSGRIAARVPSPMGGRLLASPPSDPSIRKGERIFGVSCARTVDTARYVARLDPEAYRLRSGMEE